MNRSIDVIIGATPEMIQNWGWLLAFGVVLMVLGVVAVVRAATATIASMVFFGWLLVFASVIQFVEAFMVGHWAGFFLHLLIAILFGVVGLLMVVRPVISAEALTFLMSVFFFAGRTVSVGRCDVVSSAGLGLAGLERNHCGSHGRSHLGTVAGLGALGDRSFRWN